MKEKTLKSAGVLTVSSCITFFIERLFFDILFAGLNAKRLAGQKGRCEFLRLFTGSRPVNRARFNPAADLPIPSRHTYHSLQCTAQWDLHRKRKTSRRAGHDRFARHTQGMKCLLSHNNLEP